MLFAAELGAVAEDGVGGFGDDVWVVGGGEDFAESGEGEGFVVIDLGEGGHGGARGLSLGVEWG